MIRKRIDPKNIVYVVVDLFFKFYIHDTFAHNVILYCMMDSGFSFFSTLNFLELLIISSYICSLEKTFQEMYVAAANFKSSKCFGLILFLL